jgi:hypothetical protein
VLMAQGRQVADAVLRDRRDRSHVLSMAE